LVRSFCREIRAVEIDEGDGIGAMMIEAKVPTTIETNYDLSAARTLAEL